MDQVPQEDFTHDFVVGNFAEDTCGAASWAPDFDSHMYPQYDHPQDSCDDFNYLFANLGPPLSHIVPTFGPSFDQTLEPDSNLFIGGFSGPFQSVQADLLPASDFLPDFTLPDLENTLDTFDTTFQGLADGVLQSYNFEEGSFLVSAPPIPDVQPHHALQDVNVLNPLNSWNHQDFTQIGVFAGPHNIIRPPILVNEGRKLEKRKACIACKKGDICIGLPLCERCVRATNFRSPPATLAQDQYLDLHLWSSMCESMAQLSKGLQIAGGEPSSPQSGPGSPFILELDFEDLKIRRNVHQTHSVAFLPENAPRLPPSGEEDSTFLNLRPCLLCLPQLDQFVIESMWNKLHISRSRSLSGPYLTENERDLFARAQLILGYYSLLRNLDLLSVDFSTIICSDGSMLGPIFEFIYALALRLTQLFRDLASRFPTLDDGDYVQFPSAHVRPIVYSYLVEVLQKGVTDLGCPRWNPFYNQPSHPITRLQEDFQSRSTLMVHHIRAYGCSLSSRIRLEERPAKLPEPVDFVRKAKKCFPKHVFVAIKRHQHYLLSTDLFPLQHQAAGFPLLDLVARCRCDSALEFPDSHLGLKERVPRYLVSEDNIRVTPGWSRISHHSHNNFNLTNGATGMLGTMTLKTFCIRDHPDPPRHGRSASAQSGASLAGLSISSNGIPGKESSSPGTFSIDPEEESVIRRGLPREGFCQESPAKEQQSIDVPRDWISLCGDPYPLYDETPRKRRCVETNAREAPDHASEATEPPKASTAEDDNFSIFREFGFSFVPQQHGSFRASGSGGAPK